MVIHGQGGDVPGIYPLGICRIPEPLEVGRIIDKNAGNSPLPRLMTGGYNDQTRPLRWPLKWRRIFFSKAGWLLILLILTLMGLSVEVNSLAIYG